MKEYFAKHFIGLLWLCSVCPASVGAFHLFALATGLTLVRLLLFCCFIGNIVFKSQGRKNRRLAGFFAQKVKLYRQNKNAVIEPFLYVY